MDAVGKVTSGNDTPSPVTTTIENMLYYLQALRGLAAFMVLGFHYRKFLNDIPTLPGGGELLFANGYMGVDVFFLISGFIITYSTKNQSHANPLDFAIKRFFRIVPLAWLVTLLFDYLLDWAYQPADVIRSLLFIPAKLINPPFYGYSVLAALWTLSYEFAFYAIFCIALALSHRRRTLIASGLIILCVAPFQMISKGSFILDAHAAAIPQEGLWIIPGQVFGVFSNPILFEFIIGMLCAEAYLLFESFQLKVEKHVGNLLAFAALGAGLYIFLAAPSNGHGLTAKGLGAVFIFVAFLLKQAMANGKKTHEEDVFYFIGSISYSLYLVHNSIVEQLFQLVGMKGSLEKNHGLPAFLACVMLSIVISALFYRYLETPMVRFGNYLVKQRKEWRILQKERYAMPEVG